MDDVIKKANVLIEALPYIKAFHKKTIVIKYGGSILGDANIRRSVLEDIVFLSFIGLRPILVHGGGPNISDRMRKTGKKTDFVDGMRVTDKETLLLVEEELGKLHDLIIAEIKELGGCAASLRGREVIVAKKKKSAKDLGFVGDVDEVRTDKIAGALNKNMILVLSPMGEGKDGELYNINADEVASSVAASCNAEKLILLTNVPGILRRADQTDSLLATLKESEAKKLIEENVISAGMIPKVNACFSALDKGVKKTHIIDARLPHALLLEIFTDEGVGTEISTS